MYLELADLNKRENRIAEARALYRIVNELQPLGHQVPALHTLATVFGVIGRCGRGARSACGHMTGNMHWCAA